MIAAASTAKREQTARARCLPPRASGRAAAAGLRVLGARGGELERGLAFGAIRQLFEAVLAAAAPAEREELLAGAAAPAAWVLARAGDYDAARAPVGL